MSIFKKGTTHIQNEGMRELRLYKGRWYVVKGGDWYAPLTAQHSFWRRLDNGEIVPHTPINHKTASRLIHK